jgi:hypothetical protein
MPDAAAAPAPEPSAQPAAAAPAAAPVATPAPVDPWASFQAPAGVDAKAIAPVVEWAKKSGLDPKAALAVAQRDAERAKAADDDYKHMAEKGWLEELQKDPQLGGEKTRETMVNVMRAHDKLSPEIQKIIKDEGVLYNPIVVRVLHDIGSRYFKEDSFVRPGTSPDADKKLSPVDRLARIYDTQANKK